MATIPPYTYKLLNSQNQLEIGLLNHLTQQVRMIFVFNIEFFSTFLKCCTGNLHSQNNKPVTDVDTRTYDVKVLSSCNSNKNHFINFYTRFGSRQKIYPSSRRVHSATFRQCRRSLIVSSESQSVAAGTRCIVAVQPCHDAATIT